jgi:flagellum-specific peptidoglycan hydrolase FlgJ
MNADRVAFIAKHKKDVIESTLDTGIFPSVKMAQMIIESANSLGQAGQGITAKAPTNNYFGIKADSSWKGAKTAFNTPKDGQPVSYFRVYPSVKDSISDHTLFLKKNRRYTTAGVFAAKTVADQLIALDKSGYSENPGYGAALAKMIRDYNLEELDRAQSVYKKKGL